MNEAGNHRRTCVVSGSSRVILLCLEVYPDKKQTEKAKLYNFQTELSLISGLGF
jgi:hypothetical protein